jgi:membrane protease YdiL (CAAX protease family)
MFQNIQWHLELGDKGVLSPGRWLWLRAILWASLLFSAGFFFFYASQFLGHWLHLPNQSSYATALGVPILAFWLYAIAIKKGEERNASEVIPTRSFVYDLLMGAAIGTVLITATTGLLWALGLYHVELHHWNRWYDSFVFDSYISGMLEELVFRAILLRIFARAFGIRWGLVLSSLFFGAAHLGHASWLVGMELAINGGLIMGLLYMASGRIWISVGMHIAWDFVEESILGVNSHSGLLLSTPATGKPVFLTGGKFGPDGSLLAAVIGVAAVLFILHARSAKLPAFRDD